NNVQVIQDGSPGDTDEGRAMLEEIHVVAPGSSLAFATGGQGASSFADNIQALADAGANVEVDDIGYMNSPMFNDGLIAQAADNVVSQGHAYFSAAGNDGSQGYLDSWRSMTTTVAGISGTWQDFTGTGDPLQDFTLPVGDSIQLSFQWDDAFLEGGSPLANYQ